MTATKLRLISAFSFAFVLVVSYSASAADAVEEFYSKNSVSLIVGYSAPSGYHNWARLVGKYMTKYMPGHPNFIIKDMPGAGSLTSGNFIANQAPKDGLTMGVFSRNLPTQILLGLPNANFDPRELDYIGSPEKQPTVACAAIDSSGVRSVEDLQKKELLVGGTGPAGGSSFLPLMINQLAGAKFKLVDGYKSVGEIYLAMQRGELGGVCQGYLPIYGPNKELVDSGRIKFLFNFEAKRDPTIVGNPPSIYEYVKDEASRQILDFFNASPAIGRPFAAPKGIPAERLAALRKAFNAGVNDPEFGEEAKKLQLEAGLVTGEEVVNIIKSIYAFPKPVLERAAAMQPKEGG